MNLLDDKYEKILDEGIFSENYSSIREEFRTKISWHIPSQSLIDLMAEYSPLLSVASGHAYTESIAFKQGVDIISTDISPKNNGWCKGNISFMSVEKLSCKKAILKYSNRNIFMAWPPYDHPVAYQVVKKMSINKFLIYIGESQGGCTGDDSFFGYINKHFEEISHNASVKSWFGIRDNIYVYKKIV